MRSEEWWKGRTIHIAPQYPISIENRDQECFTGNMMLALPSIYRPRRGRMKEGAALAAYFTMNISSVFGNTYFSQ